MDRQPACSFNMPQTCAFRSTQGFRQAGKAKGDMRMSYIVMEMTGRRVFARPIHVGRRIHARSRDGRVCEGIDGLKGCCMQVRMFMQKRHRTQHHREGGNEAKTFAKCRSRHAHPGGRSANPHARDV
jgi:hypothetical protein